MRILHIISVAKIMQIIELIIFTTSLYINPFIKKYNDTIVRLQKGTNTHEKLA